MIAQTQAMFSLAAETLGVQADLTTILTLIDRWSAFTVPARVAEEES